MKKNFNKKHKISKSELQKCPLAAKRPYIEGPILYDTLKNQQIEESNRDLNRDSNTGANSNSN